MTRKRKPFSQLSQDNDTTVEAKKQRSGPQKRAGTITRMVLRNFMCHQLLDVDLSSNINMIIGRNGSGKSAILTALIVGLGGKASLTNRGTSVKTFIRAGQNSGSVEIELYNEGPMAYRPAIYGCRIVILRNFTASGSGGYKIKSENGEVIASQVSEIRNITACLNIQVDNPICILNQDVSRNFLSSNDPKHKFTLFMKATRLDAFGDEYKRISQNKREAVRLFEEKQTRFVDIQTDLKNLKRKIDNHRSIVGMRDAIKVMHNELLWAKVKKAEAEVRSEELKLKKCEEKYSDLLKESENRGNLIESFKSSIQELNRQVSELKEALQVQSRPQLDAKRVIDELKVRFNEKKRGRQLLRSMIETKTKDANVLQNEIKNASDNLNRIEQEKLKRMKDLSTLTEKIKGVEEHIQTSQNDLYQISSDVSRRDDEKQHLRRDITQIDRQIQNEHNSLSALKKESGNTLLLYGQNMPLIKQKIEQNKHRFKRMPRGPLGNYIKIKDKKWALAVESYLGPGLLRSFAVDNAQDNQILMQILKETCGDRKPPIITSKFIFLKHRIQPHLVQAPRDCVSLYDMLEIDDPIVSNCIVDQAGIEGILLIPSSDRAMELLSKAVNVPRNCTQGIVMKGDKFYPDPNYKFYSNRYRRAQFLQVDTKEHAVQLERSIVELTEKKQNLENQYKQICNETRDQETRKNQLEDTIRKLQTARSQFKRQVEALRNTAEPELASVELLENELGDIKKTLQEKSAQASELEEDLKEISNKIKVNEEKLQQLKASNGSLEERMSALEDQINEKNRQQREVATGEEFDKRKIKEFETKLNEVRSTLVIKQTTVRQLTSEASENGERVETEKNIPEIVTEIQHLEKSVRKIETSTETPEALLEKYRDTKSRFDHVAVFLRILNNDIKELKIAVEKRERHYALTENYFVTFMKHSFKKVLEVRQFQGSIEIDMDNKKLELVVIPQHGSQGVTTTSNLSGGERSFSTVAFLYALWQCMEFPFYFLDEFDVYMDKLNRTKVINILLQHAESHPELQFVFLTPQDVSFIKKNVSILRLEAPERNQT